MIEGYVVPKRGSRIDWQLAKPVLAEMLAQGWLSPEIATFLGCSRAAVLSGVERLGLAFDAEAVRAHRERTCRETMNRPDLSAKRSRAAKYRMGSPEMRAAMAEIMRERVKTPAFQEAQARYMAERREDFRRRVSEGAKRRWAQKLAWCPPQFRDEYNRMIRSQRILAREARAHLQPRIDAWLRTFEGQLWRVRTGQARIVPNIKISRVVSADHSLTGSSLASL